MEEAEGSPFRAWDSYRRFRQQVIRERRFIPNEETNLFLEAVRETVGKRTTDLPAGSILWRARNGGTPIGDGEGYLPDVLASHLPADMKPDPKRALGGRANPTGIAFLYLALERQTAMAETRPWIGSAVSIGRFKVQRDLRLVDCCWKDSYARDFDDLLANPETWESEVWHSINYAFSEPVARDEPTSDYCPTQILAEVFRATGYDGLLYRSALTEGTNVVLFGLEDAEITELWVADTKSVKYEFEIRCRTVVHPERDERTSSAI